jgi:ABC-2 type transport system permease protein
VNIPGLVCVFLLTAACFISLGILSASFILVYKMGNPISWIFGSVSGLLGGVLFPVSVLPPWVRWLSYLLPVTHSLEGVRRSLLASVHFSQILPSIGALAAFSGALMPLSLIVFRLALRKAKKDGTLTQF